MKPEIQHDQRYHFHQPNSQAEARQQLLDIEKQYNCVLNKSQLFYYTTLRVWTHRHSGLQAPHLDQLLSLLASRRLNSLQDAINCHKAITKVYPTNGAKLHDPKLLDQFI